MKRDALQDPTQVRLPRALKERLSTAAATFGLTSSELIRRAIEWKLPDWEKSGVITINRATGPVEPSRARRARTLAAVAALAAALACMHSVSDDGWHSDPDRMICAGE